MIKIHKQLWYVVRPGDKENLAYMSQYEQGKDGEVLSNVAKMQATGRSWARTNSQNVWKKDNKGDYVRNEQGQLIVDHVIPAKSGSEFVTDNVPTKGFYIGDSVSRWSTSNKLFRVTDPRGFMVEVPTGNISTLLHHTTVINGVVDSECVWGREGNNHILLPINSEPYLITLDQMDTLQNKLIGVKELKVGDWVKFFEDNNEYYYAGKLKGTWSIRGFTYETSWAFSSYGNRKNEQYSDWVDVQDEKWIEVFLRKQTYSEKTTWSVQTFSKPKIIQVLRHEPMTLAVEDYSWYCPQRVENKTRIYDYYRNLERKLINVESKQND